MSKTIKTVYRNGQIELPPDIGLLEDARVTVILPDGSLEGKGVDPAFEIPNLARDIRPEDPAPVVSLMEGTPCGIRGDSEMEYPVIVEKRNGVYRALIPALAGLSAEGTSPDEAVLKVRPAAEEYLAAVEIRTIKLETVLVVQRYSTAEDWLAAAKVFEGDQEALKQHFEEIEAERRSQRTLEKHT